jgi:hypothetical protein
MAPPRRAYARTTLAPALRALSEDAARSGHVVVPHGDHICVRLPLLASVRVRVDGDGLRFSAQFGIVERSRALLGTFAIGTAGVVLAAATAATPVVVAVSAGAVLAGLYDTCRFVLTESCITRLQLLWAAHRGPPADAPREPAPSVVTHIP